MPSSSYSYALAASPTASVAEQILATSLYGPALTLAGGADIEGIYPSIPAGDLELTEDGDIRWTEGIEQAAQEQRCRLQFFLGEYFLDVRQGFPYIRDVLIKNPNRETVLSAYRRTLRSVPGITAVPTLTYSLDRQTRLLTVEYVSIWVDGSPIPDSLDFLI